MVISRKKGRKTLQAVLTDEVAEWVEHRALQLDMSVSQYLRSLILEDLAKHPKKEEKSERS